MQAGNADIHKRLNTNPVPAESQADFCDHSSIT